ncbi:hypothetical protein [Clostridium transplantifaecale]|uniref:hypothetical protein n=1 Tax=Clostridium transplantifaecale TaxID=2479838 RepID=UPI000F63518F|nr:hypothetical protein [Clostridium transplantifaecale]
MVYNKALDGAFRWHKQVSENMESDYYGLYKNIKSRNGGEAPGWRKNKEIKAVKTETERGRT